MTSKAYLLQIINKINKHFNAEELKQLAYDLGLDFDNIPGNTKINRITAIVDKLDRISHFPRLIAACQKHRSRIIWTYQARIFIAYKQHAQPDADLAGYLNDALHRMNHSVFIDQGLRRGEAWLDRIDAEIGAADFLIVLISASSIDSEMVRSEINRAKEYQKIQGHPQVLPVRVAFDGVLPYALATYLNPRQYISWQSTDDNKNLVEALIQAINEGLPNQPDPFSQPALNTVFSEDGRSSSATQDIAPPSPEFDPRFLQRLTAPGGAVRLSDKLYIERSEDAHLRQEIVQWGATITIRAPRQTGKTSLLMRGLHHARQSGAHVVFIDGQSLGLDENSEQGTFLRGLAETLCDELRIDTDRVERVWDRRLGVQKKLTNFIEDFILPSVDVPIVFALDEADALLSTSFYQHFFGLLRSWHNRRAMWPDWEKFNIALVISTEPYLLIDDINQSPFNVGLKLDLLDFDPDQFEQLNAQHGLPLKARETIAAFNLLNGQPYLTRKLLYLLAIKQHSWNELSRQATQDNGPFGDHLRRLNWSIRTQPLLKQALLKIIRTGNCDDEEALFRLQKAGLIVQMGNIVKCRCGLYEQYFELKLR